MSEDLIKRSDAIEAITYSHLDNLTREERIAHINAIPSADRAQGKWVFVARGWHTLRRCSNCMWEQTYSDPKYMGYEYDYCPNCGARMLAKDTNVPNKKGADDE